MLSRNAPSPVTARSGRRGPARSGRRRPARGGLGATTAARASTALTTALLAATALALAALSACTPDDGATPTPTGSPTAAPTSAVPTRPAPTGSTAEPTTAPTEDSGLLLIPQQLNGFAIEGQEVVFLVALADSFATDSGGPGPGGSGDAPGGSDQSDTRRASASDLPITITAEAANATVTVLEPTLAEAADIAEVIVVPDPGSTGSTVTLTITGTGADVTVTASASFDVVEGVDDRAADAERIRDLFIPWLAENRPELEITAATPWAGTIVSPQWLVVSHYLFLTAEWEMHVEWHIMVAPDDWARIDLRRRFEEVAPSRAFEISSVTEGGEPHEIDPPEQIWR